MMPMHENYELGRLVLRTQVPAEANPFMYAGPDEPLSVEWIGLIEWPATEDVEIVFYNLTGESCETLWRDSIEAAKGQVASILGRADLRWDGSDLPWNEERTARWSELEEMT